MKSAFLAWAAILLLSSPAIADDTDEKSACAAAAEHAQTERQQRHLRAARELLVQCSREACPSAVRVDCASWLQEVDASVPTISLRARDERGQDLVDVRVTFDGQPLVEQLDGTALAVDPGVHVLRFEARGFEPAELKALLPEGEKHRPIVATLQAVKPIVAVPPSPAPQGAGLGRALPWVLFGVGAVGFGAFTALQITARSDLSDLRAGCGQTHSCSRDDVDALKVRFNASVVAFGVGAAAVAAGGALLIFRSSDARPRASITVVPTPFGAGLRAVAVF